MLGGLSGVMRVAGGKEAQGHLRVLRAPTVGGCCGEQKPRIGVGRYPLGLPSLPGVALPSEGPEAGGGTSRSEGTQLVSATRSLLLQA